MHLLKLSIPLCDLKFQNIGEISPITSGSEALNVPNPTQTNLHERNLSKLKQEDNEDDEDSKWSEDDENDEDSKLNGGDKNDKDFKLSEESYNTSSSDESVTSSASSSSSGGTSSNADNRIPLYGSLWKKQKKSEGEKRGKKKQQRSRQNSPEGEASSVDENKIPHYGLRKRQKKLQVTKKEKKEQQKTQQRSPELYGSLWKRQKKSEGEKRGKKKQQKFRQNSPEEESDDISTGDKSVTSFSEESDDISTGDESVTSSSGETSSVDENRIPNYWLKKRQKKWQVTKKKKKKQQKTQLKSPEKLSKFEEMVAKNRAEKMAFLESLKMDEAKADLKEVVNTIKMKKKRPPRVKQVHTPKSPPVLRKSHRLAKTDIDFSEKAVFNKGLMKAHNFSKRNDQKIPSRLSFKNALLEEELYCDYVRDIPIQRRDTGIYSSYELSAIKNLTFNENNIVKINPEKITSLAWYPSPESLILTVGSKNLSIWNVKSNSRPYTFRIHMYAIADMKFNPYNSALFTLSSDGTMCCGDLSKQSFNQINDTHSSKGHFTCLCFDFLSEYILLVSKRFGNVAIADTRIGRKDCKTMKCHNRYVTSVNCHPANQNYFVTADAIGTIRLWDLRKIQECPVANITHHKRCVSSAYFSPVTGNSILATSFDDTVSLFDSTNLTQDIKLKKSMTHYNFILKGSSFKATWFPNSEEAFAISKIENPNCKTEIFDQNFNVYHTITHPNLTASCLNAFHPSVPALAGESTNGNVFAFT